VWWCVAGCPMIWTKQLGMQVHSQLPCTALLSVALELARTHEPRLPKPQLPLVTRTQNWKPTSSSSFLLHSSSSASALASSASVLAFRIGALVCSAAVQVVHVRNTQTDWLQLDWVALLAE
jgi:hypothetical protein